MDATADSADERGLLYERLNRRNRVVGFMRWIVPAVGLVVTGGLVVQIIIANLSVDYGLTGISYQDGKVVIADPRYGGLTGDGITYDVVADNAYVLMENPDLIDMENAVINTVDEDDYRMTATAAEAHLDLGVEQVTIEGLMTTIDSDGVTGELYRSLIDWSGQKLVSDGPVRFSFEDGSAIASETLTYNANREVWRFGPSLYTNPGDDEQPPTEITSDRLIYRAKDGTASFDGNAVVKQEGTTVYSEALLVTFGNGGTSSFERIDASGGVRVVEPEQTATGETGTYDPNARVLHLNGDVRVVSDTSTITATQLAVDMSADVTEFTTDGQSRVNGDFNPPDADRARIESDRMRNAPEEDRTEFTGNAIVRMAEQTVWTSRFIVHYAPGDSTDIRSYEMLGNVRIRNPDQTATGDRGVYNPDTRILRLTGNVRVTNDSGTVDAPELRVNLATNVSEFTATSSGNRVTGVFTPDNPPENR